MDKRSNCQVLRDNDKLQQVEGECGGSNNSYRDDLPPVIDGTWKLKECLGTGATGVVYRVVNVHSNKEFAIKVDRMVSAKRDIIRNENEVYKLVKGGKGIANVYWCGKIKAVKGGYYDALVMDKLGAPLDELLAQCGGTFSVPTVAQLGDQIVNIFEDFHGNSFIHRDVKPQNFMMGNPETGDKHTVYLIDFGFSREYWNSKSLVHSEYREDKQFVGTVPYASLNVHLGISQGRRDDLEAVGYLLVYFLKGKLPWTKYQEETDDSEVNDNDKMTYRENVLNWKMMLTPEQLCAGLPKQFADYFRYVRTLQFSDMPDYAYLRGLFRAIGRENGGNEDNFTFDWEKTKETADLTEGDDNLNDFVAI